MKDRIILTIITLSLTCSLFAQEQKNGRLEFGVKGGVNASTADTHYKKSSFTLGYHAGITTNYYIGEAFFLNSGLEYIVKGADTKSETPLNFISTEGGALSRVNVQMDYKLHYLQLPISIGYEVVQKDKFSVNLQVGFYFAYGLSISAKEHIQGLYTSPSSQMVEMDYNVKHDDWDWLNMHRLDFGVLGGLGVKYDRLFLNFSYQYALTNIGDSKVNNSAMRFRWKNRNVALSTGFNFIAK